ncbi:MAG TPA: FTR1 family protein [Limnochordia bacterium]
MRVDALLITFREALEALLIVGIILSYLRRTDRTAYSRWIWLGVGLALASSLVVAFLLQVVFVSFTFIAAEIYFKVGIMFIASLLLAHMVLWMAKQSRQVKSELEEALDQHTRAGNLRALVALSYFAVLREGVETVLFLAALGHGDIGAAVSGFGAITGFVLAGALAWMIFRTAVRVPLKLFFRVSGFALLLIAAGLCTQGVGILQDLGVIGSYHPQVFDLTWLMPEHPIDEMHFIRDTGRHPLIPSEVGVFFKALFGYSAAPSIEEIAAYIAFFGGVWGFEAWLGRRERQRAAAGRLAPAPSKH